MKSRMIGLSVLLMFFLSAFLQTKMYLDWDLLFTLEGGRRLLEGGDYFHDLFENNPPLIYYFSMGIVYFSQITGLQAAFIYKLYIYLMAGYSIGMSYYLLDTKQTWRALLVPALAFCLLLIPVNTFGEREHIMIALVFPYFLLRFGPQIYNLGLRTIISLFAGLGFALKPHFLLALISAELLFSMRQKSWLHSLCLEPCIVVLVQIVYMITIVTYMPDFYQKVLPLIMEYYAFNRASILFLISNPPVIACMVSLGVSACLPRPWPVFIQLFCMLGVAFTLSYFLQGKGWYYHLLPVITVTVLWMAVLAHQLLFKLQQHKMYPVLLIVLIGSFFFCILLPMIERYKVFITCYTQDTCGYASLISFAKNHAKNKPIYFFTTQMQYSIPIIYYSQTKHASRFATLWVISGMLNKEIGLNGICDQVCMDGKTRVRNFIIEDINRYQPSLVFVDISPSKAYIHRPFDYLPFMKQSPEFMQLWSHYHYVKTIGQYAVYSRLSSP
ncbi:MAG: hypothetical protein H0U75_03420 [Legionella sp.]|nr:hypothetical protein [Legionella sp.]